jgi:hypothetical protein
MSKFAATTEVTPDKSRAEIEATLRRYGADQFMYGWQEASAMVGFRMEGRLIKFVLPLPTCEDPAFTEYKQGSVTYRRTESEIDKRYQQATRQRWRALALVIKAKMEAVESGISVFDDEFLANIVLADGQLVGDWMRPQIEEAYRIGTMPRLLPMLPPPRGEAE